MSKATLPLALVAATLLWVVLPAQHPFPTLFSPDYGLWKWLSPLLSDKQWSEAIAGACTAIVIYMIAELNNANVLLRINSRTISATFAILSGMTVSAHHLQPSSFITLLTVISFFPLFSSYHRPSPLLALLTFLPISIASLIFPRLLYVVPVYMCIKIHLQALSLRSFTALLLAIALPYWFYGGIAVINGTTNEFLAHILTLADFRQIDYATLLWRDVAIFAFGLLLFLSGTIDFFIHQYLDKTRTRFLHRSVIIFGTAIAVCIALQPQYIHILQPLLTFCAAVTFGHFFALTHTRFSHIYCLILLAFTLAVLAAQYFLGDLHVGDTL